MTYTPGPWTIHQSMTSKKGIDIYSKEAGMIVLRTTQFPVALEDARLIAASPKLYKALEQLVWAIETQASGKVEHALAFAKAQLATLD